MRALALTLIWGGAGLAAVAANQNWWAVEGRTAGVTGAAATTGAAVALPLAALAGALLAAWLRGVGARVLFVLVGLLLAGGVAVGTSARPEGSIAGAGLLDGAAILPQPWLWLYPVAAGLGAVGAVLLQFAPPAAPRSTSGTTADASLDAWRRLDAGDDPT